METLAKVFLKSASLSVLVMSVLAFFGALSPVIDIFSHFRWQYATLLSLFTLIAFALKCHRLSLLLLAGALVNGSCVLVLWYPLQINAGRDADAELSILNMNLNYGNRSYDLVEERIRKYNPDMITLEELTPEMLAHLKNVLSSYPYQCVVTRRDPYGTGIFSKRELLNVNTNPLKLQLSLLISADILVDSGIVSVFCIHSCGPTSSLGCALNKSVAESLSRLHDQDPRRSVILIGDMNSTPWSNVFRQYSSSFKLRDSEKGFGLQCSWPVGVPILQIPIDHCLFTRDWLCTYRTLGASVNSDHYPLYVRLTRKH